MDFQSLQYVRSLEERIRVLEEERELVRQAISEYRRFRKVHADLMHDLKTIPAFGARIPPLAELPVGLDRAMRHRGPIETAKIDAGLRPGRDF